MTSLDGALAAPFVRNDSGALSAALLVRVGPAIANVRPTHGEPSPIAERAAEQQQLLIARLKAHGVRTIVLDGAPGAALGALAADTAVMFPDGAFLMRPSDPSRRAEIPAVEAALGQAGVPIVGRIEAPGLLDGGDVLFAPRTLFLAVSSERQEAVGIPKSTRGNALGRAQLASYARSIGLDVVEVALASDVRHLRSVVSLLDADTIALAPGSVDAAAFDGFARVDVPRGEEAGAGVLALGARRVLANLRFRESVPRLRKANVAVDAIDLWEFGKIGATPSGLVLALKRG